MKIQYFCQHGVEGVENEWGLYFCTIKQEMPQCHYLPSQTTLDASGNLSHPCPLFTASDWFAKLKQQNHLEQTVQTSSTPQQFQPLTDEELLSMG